MLFTPEPIAGASLGAAVNPANPGRWAANPARLKNLAKLLLDAVRAVTMLPGLFAGWFAVGGLALVKVFVFAYGFRLLAASRTSRVPAVTAARKLRIACCVISAVLAAAVLSVVIVTAVVAAVAAACAAAHIDGTGELRARNKPAASKPAGGAWLGTGPLSTLPQRELAPETSG